MNRLLLFTHTVVLLYFVFAAYGAAAAKDPVAFIFIMSAIIFLSYKLNRYHFR